MAENDKLAREVGSFSYKALMKAASLVKPGAKFLDVANSVESFAKENGFGCAFPLNLSVNNEAAHYTPSLMDEKVFGDKDVVKVDFGASKEGVLGDCAVTVDLSHEKGDLVDAAKLCLENAISKVRAGVHVHDIGAEIQRTAESAGFSPIVNLGGHSVETHDLHSDIFVPNFDNGDDTELEEGMTVAIEPFITDGNRTQVIEADVCEIYGLVGEASVRNPDARSIQKEIIDKYTSEPFAVRWLSNVVSSKFNLYRAVKELVMAGALESYPMLVVQDMGTIAQAEAEIIVTKDGCEVLTK